MKKSGNKEPYGNEELLERLMAKLDEIIKDPDMVKGILYLLETDEEREIILDIAENGGEEATPKNLVYAAININDERETATHSE